MSLNIGYGPLIENYQREDMGLEHVELYLSDGRRGARS